MFQRIYWGPVNFRLGEHVYRAQEITVRPEDEEPANHCNLSGGRLNVNQVKLQWEPANRFAQKYQTSIDECLCQLINSTGKS